MEVQINPKLHNRFDIELCDSRTGEVKQKAYAENIILNQAWAQILADQDWATNIYFGTGTGTLTASRTALFTPLSSRAVSEPIYSGSFEENWYSLRQKVQILETEYNGTILTEIGIGTASVLCTHAMLKDMNGNQVSITKVSSDIIVIYATIYLRLSTPWSKTAPVDFVRFRPGNNPVICWLLGKRRVTNGNYDNGVLNPCIRISASTSECPMPPVKDINLVTVQSRVFDAVNKKLTLYHRIAASDANVSGLKMCVLESRLYLYSGSPTYVIPGIIVRFSRANVSHLFIEQIGTGDGVTTAFATTFPFIGADTIVKVDGAVVSPTIISGTPRVQDIKGYVYQLGATGNGELSNFLNTNPPTNSFPSDYHQDDLIVENPFYASYGIDTITGSYVTIFTSNNMSDWTQVFTTASSNQTYTVLAEHKQKRYWKFVKNGTQWKITSMNCMAFSNLKNIVFSAAPPVGAVVTAEYYADCAVKDINHVLDITVVIQLGEYT